MLDKSSIEGVIILGTFYVALTALGAYILTPITNQIGFKDALVICGILQAFLFAFVYLTSELEREYY